MSNLLKVYCKNIRVSIWYKSKNYIAIIKAK